MDFCKEKDSFCYICGHFVVKRNKRKRNDKFVELYRNYYEMEWIDELYTPNIGCSACYTSLVRWSENRNKKPKYKHPVMWFNPGEHDESECYFCVNKTTEAINKKKVYNGTLHAHLPVEHRIDSPPTNVYEDVSEQPADAMDIDVDVDNDLDIDICTDPEQPSASSYVPSHLGAINIGPKLVTQPRLDNMCRRLELSQRKSQLLASMLKEDNLLSSEVTIISQKHRQAAYIPFFQTEGDLTFCKDINALMEKMEINYDVEDWRLFIDASASGLKTILLHNDNAFLPVPIAYSKVLKETHDSMRLIFEKIKYNEHKWDVSGDLKVVALIMGLQLGRTKNACFICTWISTAKIDHYHATWEKRSTFITGEMNIRFNSLVPPEKILLPTLHIKLGLVSAFIRKMNKQDDAFKYLGVLFPRLSLAKREAGISYVVDRYNQFLNKRISKHLGSLNGPDIRKLVASDKFIGLLSPFEREAFNNMKAVFNNFLGNHRAENYRDIVHNMLMSFSQLKINMTPKMHYLHQHLDFFRDHLGKISDEHGERFHQQIKLIEERFRGKRIENMLAEFIWYSMEEQEEEQQLHAGRLLRTRSSVSLRSDRLALLDM